MLWNDIKKKTPMAYKTGDWDGRKSDILLVKTMGGKYFVAEMYQGVIDGSEFRDFYATHDDSMLNVTHWTEIDTF